MTSPGGQLEASSNIAQGGAPPNLVQEVGPYSLIKHSGHLPLGLVLVREPDLALGLPEPSAIRLPTSVRSPLQPLLTGVEEFAAPGHRSGVLDLSSRETSPSFSARSSRSSNSTLLLADHR